MSNLQDKILKFEKMTSWDIIMVLYLKRYVIMRLTRIKNKADFDMLYGNNTIFDILRFSDNNEIWIFNVKSNYMTNSSKLCIDELVQLI
jgi:hypothetical protein